MANLLDLVVGQRRDRRSTSRPGLPGSTPSRACHHSNGTTRSASSSVVRSSSSASCVITTIRFARSSPAIGPSICTAGLLSGAALAPVVLGRIGVVQQTDQPADVAGELDVTIDDLGVDVRVEHHGRPPAEHFVGMCREQRDLFVKPATKGVVGDRFADGGREARRIAHGDPVGVDRFRPGGLGSQQTHLRRALPSTPGGRCGRARASRTGRGCSTVRRLLRSSTSLTTATVSNTTITLAVRPASSACRAQKLPSARSDAIPPANASSAATASNRVLRRNASTDCDRRGPTSWRLMSRAAYEVGPTRTRGLRRCSCGTPRSGRRAGGTRCSTEP